jgi:hypothetical protein
MDCSEVLNRLRRRIEDENIWTWPVDRHIKKLYNFAYSSMMPNLIIFISVDTIYSLILPKLLPITPALAAILVAGILQVVTWVNLTKIKDFNLLSLLIVQSIFPTTIRLPKRSALWQLNRARSCEQM